jgi:hypothetical protein
MWGLVFEPDYITAWRATQIVTLLKVINNSTLANAYYAAKRTINDTDKHKISLIINEIGQERARCQIQL